MPKISHKIIRYTELSSTNDKCMELSKQGSLEPYTVVLAENQTNGKGQNGNKWHAKKGLNLTFSLYVPHYNFKVENQFCLNKAIAIGLNASISQLINQESKIKWPNDIMVENEKISGILIENLIQGQFLSKSIVGIGINVNQTEFGLDYGNPTSVYLQTGQKHLMDEVLNIVLGNLLKQIELVHAKDFTTINTIYDANLFKKDEVCSFKTQRGSIKARVNRVDNNGALVVSNATGIYTMKHGEIKFNLN